MMHVRPYTTLTHMHALDSMHALYFFILPALRMLIACVTTLVTYIRTFISSTYAHIHTYMQQALIQFIS